MTPHDPAMTDGQSTSSFDQRGQSIQGSQTNITGPVTVIQNAPQSQSLYRRYLEEVIQDCNLLPWRIVNPHFASPDRSANLRLADIYTDLDTTLLRPIDLKGEGELRNFLRQIAQHERVPVQQVTDEAPRLLILGDPGSGKSTFMKHLAYTLAQARLATDAQATENSAAPDVVPHPVGALQPWSHGLLLPLRVELRHVAAFAESHTTTDKVRLFMHYLEHRLDEWRLKDFWPETESLFRQPTPQLLVLLDGLDEVATDQRSLLVDLVNDLVARYRQHRYLVTCRPYAYVGQPWQLADFRTVTLAPFNPPQINRFVENWYARLAEREQLDAPTRQRRLQEALRRPDLRALAECPLLLTVMAQLHTFSSQLPDDRGQLYADSVNLLLQRWESRHDQKPSLLEQLAIPGLRLDDLEAALAHVAFQAQSQQATEASDASADIGEGELRQWLAPYFHDDWNKAGRFIAYIRERAGLLIRHQTAAYIFPHRTFQEYLAACHLVNSADYPTTAADLVRADPVRWREVFLLAAGRAPVGQAIAAVNALCPDEVELSADAATWRQALIAGDALCEIGRIRVERQPAGQAQLARTRRWLVQALRQDQLFAPAERSAAGRTLARLGDPRAAVMRVEEMEFCYVPPGPFMMGSTAADEWAKELERPQHQVNLSYPYWIARYPVTNAQFDQFIAADSYENADYWLEAEAANRWHKGAVTRHHPVWNEETQEYEFPAEITDGPYPLVEPFNLSNHPRVDINWYEAVAFVRWLNLHLQQLGYLPDGYEVHLPSEAEWEKAARGGLQVPTTAEIVSVRQLHAAVLPSLKTNTNPTRRLPWGNDYITNYLSARETGLMATSAVGAFPSGRSPVGAEEMSGTVREWTRTLLTRTTDDVDFTYPYDLNDGREELTAGYRISRILRGGAFGDTELQWTTTRGYSSPQTRYRVFGIRCVIVPTDRRYSAP